MGIFGKSAQQKRIDELAAENARLKSQGKQYKDARDSEREAHAATREKYSHEIARAERMAGRLTSAHVALRDIAAMVTPGAAHAARKMAARATDALPVDLAASMPKPNGTAAAVQGVR
jgi:hypothetical protein